MGRTGLAMLELYAPLITPFSDDESLDLRGFLRNLAWYESQPLDGYLINGSSGEADMLSAAEQLELLEATCANTGRAVFAGIAPTSVRVGLADLRRLRHLELRGVLVRTPSYFGSQLDQRQFYRALAEASSHPIVIYQIPQNTGIKLDESTLEELCQHPNIMGMKDSLGDLSLLQEVTPPPHFHYYLGAANLLLPGLRAGASGGILALADLVPGHCRRLLELFQAGDSDGAAELQRRLNPLNRAIGGSRGFGIAGLKAAVELQGLTGGAPRRPLRAITEHGRQTLQELLASLSSLPPGQD